MSTTFRKAFESVTNISFKVFKLMFGWTTKIKIPPKRPYRLLAYISAHGEVRMWSEKVDPEELYNVYGYTRIPHLDEPKGEKQIC